MTQNILDAVLTALGVDVVRGDFAQMSERQFRGLFPEVTETPCNEGAMFVTIFSCAPHWGRPEFRFSPPPSVHSEDITDIWRRRELFSQNGMILRVPAEKWQATLEVFNPKQAPAHTVSAAA